MITPRVRALAKTGGILAGGRIGISLLRFARNILLARLLSVEDYGIASTFIIALAFVELVGDFALDRLVVQDREGDSPRFVAVIQALALLRGIVLSTLLFVLAGLMANLFGHPEISWAYQLFAAAPLIRSLAHLDMARQQRAMKFHTLVIAEFVAVASTIIALWPVVQWLGNYRVILVILLLENIIRTGVTFTLAQLPYRVAWDRAIFFRAVSFGWPLLVSGALAFAVLQGERILVASQFTAHDLGIFSAALTLAMTPCLVIANISQSFLLPILSRVKDYPKQFVIRCRASIQGLAIIASVGMVGFVILGPELYLLSFGSDYFDNQNLIVLLGLIFTLRLARSGPTTISLSVGRTKNLIYANFVRILFFPLAALIALEGGSITSIVLIGIAAEFCSLVSSLLLLLSNSDTRPGVRVCIPAVLGIGTVAILLALTELGHDMIGYRFWALGVPFLIVLLCPTIVDLFWRVLWLYVHNPPKS